MNKAMTPNEVLNKKNTSIPDFVIDAVNTLLIKKITSQQAKITLKEVEEGVVKNYRSVDLKVCFENNYFDFEEIYRDKGWIVTFDKSGHNESYDSFYTFSIK